MGTDSKSVLAEVGRNLLIACVPALFAAVALASRLEERVQFNREEARNALMSAVAIRRAEMDARVTPLENAFKAQGEALRELVSLARDNAKGNEQVLVRIAKIEGKLDAYGEKLADHISESTSKPR